MRNDETPSFIDLFSGAGGFSRGFEEAGFKGLVAVDNHPPTAKAYKENFPHTIVLQENIATLNGFSLIQFSRKKPLVVLASPPCEPFTAANPHRQKHPIDRLYKDPAGRLYLHAIRLIGEIQPEYFVIENVAGILDDDIRSSIERELGKRGYGEVYFNILNAEKHGVPSKRRRVFVANFKIALKKEDPIPVEEALKGLPPPGAPYPFNHEETILSPRKTRNIPKLRWGDALIRYTGAGGRKYPNYIRLHPKKPAPTVMGTSRFVHPYEDRLLTVREQARLMGFPDYHVFVGSKDSQYNQVGEAVPPPLSKRIAEQVLKLISA
ncbi:MAG: DNA cytosine methyltransferase [Desulfurococcales archaeon]|nr:DNA cytosine methyltransferase [Desulfurococcales archaeon]